MNKWDATGGVFGYDLRKGILTEVVVFIDTKICVMVQTAMAHINSGQLMCVADVVLLIKYTQTQGQSNG